jgi:hypothetical protein
MAGMETKNSRAGAAEHTARLANKVIEQAKRGCVDRGVGLDGKPLNRCHVYLEGAVKCQCGEGPLLELRRMK